MKITLNRPDPAPAAPQTVTITLEDFPIERVRFLKAWLNRERGTNARMGISDGYIFSRLSDALNNTDL